MNIEDKITFCEKTLANNIHLLKDSLTTEGYTKVVTSLTTKQHIGITALFATPPDTQSVIYFIKDLYIVLGMLRNSEKESYYTHLVNDAYRIAKGVVNNLK